MPCASAPLPGWTYVGMLCGGDAFDTAHVAHGMVWECPLLAQIEVLVAAPPLLTYMEARDGRASYTTPPLLTSAEARDGGACCIAHPLSASTEARDGCEGPGHCTTAKDLPAANGCTSRTTVDPGAASVDAESVASQPTPAAYPEESADAKTTAAAGPTVAAAVPTLPTITAAAPMVAEIQPAPAAAATPLMGAAALTVAADHFFCMSPDACTNPTLYWLGALAHGNSKGAAAGAAAGAKGVASLLNNLEIGEGGTLRSRRATDSCDVGPPSLTHSVFDLGAALGPFPLDLGDILYAPNIVKDPEVRPSLVS